MPKPEDKLRSLLIHSTARLSIGDNLVPVQVDGGIGDSYVEISWAHLHRQSSMEDLLCLGDSNPADDSTLAQVNRGTNSRHWHVQYSRLWTSHTITQSVMTILSIINLSAC